MSVTRPAIDGGTATRASHDGVAELARDASIEINAAEVKHLDASRALLPAGKKIYVSHLPKQSWNETIEVSRAVHAAGFTPVPHVPVRLIQSADTADRLLAELKDRSHVSEVLLISGDYARIVGPYSSVFDFLRDGLLSKHGFKRVSFAGHPEGHPQVPLEEIRRAEIEKAQWAEYAGMTATLMTQFFFESDPFIEWVQHLRRNGVRSQIVAGLAGPASITALARFAVRCGVGRSVRALSKRPSVMNTLLGDHGPETLMNELAVARMAGEASFAGIHIFGFGGFLRTCKWLQQLASDRSAR
ncbi:MAG TPA: methylenetetrahydrofolate reductase [Steroidobacteraceae bacterium]|nr:methylenetetrahydrofolate reductase [Steroidobacteraceae bacterium]